MPRRPLVTLMLACLALGMVACRRRPDFDLNAAQVEIARAFERGPRQVAIYGDSRGEGPAEWLIDFRLDGIQPSLQARFRGLADRWELSDVRVRPDGTDETPWQSVGVLLGRLKGEARDKAVDTMTRMGQLADYIGQYAVRNGNRFPRTDMPGLKTLLLSDGTIREQDWRHDVDAWGQQILYHASREGSNYIIVAMGGDNTFDIPVPTYEDNVQQGLEAYGGMSSNPDADVIIASGTLVQGYE